MYEPDSTQLYFVRNRWYDPVAGRFVTEDPIGVTGGINLYAFAGNDPINGYDPTGLWHMDCYGYQYNTGLSGTSGPTATYYIGNSRTLHANVDVNTVWKYCIPQADPGDNVSAGAPISLLAESPLNNGNFALTSMLLNNITTASRHSSTDWSWLKNMVQAGGIWDYKRYSSTVSWSDFGNFNYGVVTSAMGINSQILHLAAGLMHIFCKGISVLYDVGLL